MTFNMEQIDGLASVLDPVAFSEIKASEPDRSLANRLLRKEMAREMAERALIAGWVHRPDDTA